MGPFILGFVTAILGISADQRVCWYTSRTVGGLSVRLVETAPDYADESDYGTGQIRGPNQTCPKRTNYCYALWQEVRRNRSVESITIIAQGCWESSGKQDCERANCVTSRKPPKALNDTNFCCCKGNFCNGNVTQMYYPDYVEISSVSDEKSAGKFYVLIVAVLIVFFVLTISCPPALWLMTRNFDERKNKKKSNFQSDSIHLMENEMSHDPNFTCENLKLEKLIGQGRYGSVWKGSIGDQELAVKIFQSHHRNYFFNEIDIYCVPFMAHPSLLSYLGYDERMGPDGNPEYLLFLSLAPNGTVQEFIKSNVIDWNTFCKMALSIAKGVAYLHSDIRKGSKFKPCVSHRDLNTTNILVKEDMTCVICDLGFATKISGSKYYYNGEEQRAEIKSINDVGTLRYMSPEVLEGAVNLRDCETALKQIDVYALGLILWEISTRCSDFYPPGMYCGPYRLPFEAEIGHPTFEQMQILVCKHKARPLFPDLWKDSSAVRSVKETIEDCWDQDAEARLTALCVEERFHELSGMSERQKVSFHSSNGISPAGRISLTRRDSQNALVISEGKEESCVSESTVETTVAVTPANPKDSNRFQGLCSNLSVQPYQGRNPCLERNLMLPKDCDSNSADLIEKSRKNSSAVKSNPVWGGSRIVAEDYFNVRPSNSTITENSANLIYSNYVNGSEPITFRSNAPIPFVKNVRVDRTNRTKESNLSKSGEDESKKKIMGWKNLRKIFEAKKKDSEISRSDYNLDENLITEEMCDNNPSTPVAATATVSAASADSKLETEVLLHKGKPETKINCQIRPFSVSRLNESADETGRNHLLEKSRPNSLPIKKMTDLSKSDSGSGKMAGNANPVGNGQMGTTGRRKGPETRDGNETENVPESSELKILKSNLKKTKEGEVGDDDFSAQFRSGKMSGGNKMADAGVDSIINSGKRKNSARFSLRDDRIMSGCRDNEMADDRQEIFRSFENIEPSHNI